MNPNPLIRIARSIGPPCHPGAGARNTIVGTLGQLGAAAALLAAFSGCAAETKLLSAHQQFTPAELVAGGLAVVGVVEKEEVEQVRPPLIAALESVLRQERPDLALTLVPADSVRAALGAAAYRRLLNTYQATGTIDSLAMRAVGEALHGAVRYGVVARVVSNATRTSRRSVAPGDSAGYRLVTTVLVMGRDARVVIQVYDLRAGTAVYDAQFLGSSEASGFGSGPGQGSFSPNSGVTFQVPDHPRPEDEGASAPPDLARALEEAFRSFARSLPRAGT
jgi:hypothetical protein